jgi:hypothetical protein
MRCRFGVGTDAVAVRSWAIKELRNNWEPQRARFLSEVEA